jgi:PAS domain S-box-containing protein
MQDRFRLAAIVESSEDAIIGKNLEGNITDWNKGAEQTFGYSANEMIGKSISLLAPPDRADDLAEILRKIERGGSINHFETARLKKGGTRIDVSLTVSPLIDIEGRIVGASGIARDISERKHEEAILRESEERFRLVADTAPAMIWTSNPEKASTFANKAWLDFTSRSMAAELAIGWAEGIHPEDGRDPLTPTHRPLIVVSPSEWNIGSGATMANIDGFSTLECRGLIKMALLPVSSEAVSM